MNRYQILLPYSISRLIDYPESEMDNPRTDQDNSRGSIEFYIEADSMDDACYKFESDMDKILGA
jgi:hypothetical protein